MPEVDRNEPSEGSDLPRAFAYAGAACYVAGLLIFNIDLARHGIWDVEIGRAQYVLIGLLWFVLIVLGVAWVAAALSIPGLIVKAVYAEKFSWRRVHVILWRTLVALVSAAICEWLAYAFLLWVPVQLLTGEDAIFNWYIGSVVINAFAAGFGGLMLLSALGYEFGGAAPFLSGGLIRRGSFSTFAKAESWGVLPFGMLLSLLGLGIYASGLFPYLSRTWGGGRPTMVRLVLTQSTGVPWGSGIWVSPNGKRVGPVELLLEKDSAVIVGRAEDFDPNVSPSVASPAIAVSNSLIEAILRVPEPNNNDDVLLIGGEDDHANPLLSGNIYNAFRQRFSSPDGGLKTARRGHTATRLPGDHDPLILITGGEDAAHHALSAVEAYGRSSKSSGFYAKRNMTTARVDHTATLLSDTSILIAGGRNDAGLLASAERFLPRVEAFRATSGSMVNARAGHSATALARHTGPRAGQVLIAGGLDSLGEALPTAELYDPATDTFALTGGMVTRRTGHTATLLRNGQVLVTGGRNRDGLLKSAELYDPGSGVFRAAASLNTPRENHTATVLNDGRVLITGGRSPAGILGSAEVYDPAHDAFSLVGAMVTPREGHTATLLEDGTVLVAGGRDSAGHALKSAELFDEWKEWFQDIGLMEAPAYGARAAVLRSGARH